jgi:hypothetical protein
MTYHAVENYLRKYRKEAKDMRAQATGRENAPNLARPRSRKADTVSLAKAGM